MKRSAAKQYALLGVLLLWALMAQGIFSGFAIYSSESNQQARLPFSLRDYSAVIAGVFGDYQKGGFRPGDEIIAIDGERVIGRSDDRGGKRTADAWSTIDRQLFTAWKRDGQRRSTFHWSFRRRRRPPLSGPM
jgi:hypothetical protein